MGQAKRRGTFEERRAAAVKRDGITYEEARKQRAAKEALATEEQRQREREGKALLAALLTTGTIPYYI